MGRSCRVAIAVAPVALRAFSAAAQREHYPYRLARLAGKRFHLIQPRNLSSAWGQAKTPPLLPSNNDILVVRSSLPTISAQSDYSENSKFFS